MIPDKSGRMVIADDELIRSFRDGNDIAFVTLYNRYKYAIYNFCLKMLADSDTAKDTTQCIFIKVYEKHDQLDQPGRFRQWLFAIARNECISHLRKNKVFTPLPDDMADANPDSGYSAVDKDGEIALVNDAINRLDPDLREVIVLREYQNLSYREIGEIVGISEKTVKSRLFRARQLMYEILKPHFDERS
jgi:RNA polymerase sigma-70 factor (ECF subfamily)